MTSASNQLTRLTTQSELASAFSSAFIKLGVDLGYNISQEEGGADTITLARNRSVGGRKVQFLATMRFHGATLFVAIMIDPVNWDRKTSAEADAIFAWTRHLNANGMLAAHFGPAEINASAMLCADVVLNYFIDFQSGRIRAAAAGVQ